MIDCLIGSMA